MIIIGRMTYDLPPIQGRTASGLESIRDVFIANFIESVDVGAGLCITHGDDIVVDLWGGHQDLAQSVPWCEDTLVNVYSTTKGFGAAAVAWAVEQGALDYDAPVKAYWPVLRAASGGLTVAQLLSHQGGLCGVSDTLTVEDLYDWEKMCALLERQEPFWSPGTAVGYHAITWGYLAGNLIRIVTGRTMGDVFRTEIAAPLRADCHIGLTEGEMTRVAPMIAAGRARILPDAGQLAAIERPALHSVALDNPIIRPYGDASSRPWQAAEIAASNGHATARGVAGLYAALACGGVFQGVRVLKSATIDALTREEVGEQDDLVLDRVLRRGRGVILNTGGEYGPSARAFGHAGAGGSLGFADPEHGIAFGYVMNQMQTTLDGDTRAGRLVRALYDTLG